VFESLEGAWRYAIERPEVFATYVRGHLSLVGFALGAAITVAIPLGVLTARVRWISGPVINSLLALRVVPSLAVLFLAIPYLGLGIRPAALALVLLAVPPVLVNTDAALRSIDPAIRDAARGMGMNPLQILRHVEMPLAIPAVVAGIRTATVESIASATLAAFVGAKSLGSWIVLGFAAYDTKILLAGALPVAALALAADAGLGVVQRFVEPQR
jgi:osmoprotectant transport system permease protein